MKLGLVFLVTILSFGASEAHTKGCLKGAIVGGVAGHYVGHHGVLGATAGCVVGRHEAKKHERARIQQQKNQEIQNGEEKL
jgi:outer membrane lipoprotein SlyB